MWWLGNERGHKIIMVFGLFVFSLLFICFAILSFYLMPFWLAIIFSAGAIFGAGISIYYVMSNISGEAWK